MSNLECIVFSLSQSLEFSHVRACANLSVCSLVAVRHPYTFLSFSLIEFA